MASVHLLIEINQNSLKKKKSPLRLSGRAFFVYSVVLSYRNDKFFADWVHNTLYDTLVPLLKNELNKGEVRIFMDKEEIKSGDDWSNRIKRALVRSRCMIPVFIPDYFHREWCIRELAVMLHRQKELGYNTAANPSGLILPIHLHDGEHYPSIAKKIQGKDFKKYFRPNVAGELQNEFFSEMLDWAKTIAIKIKNAPEWDDDWLNPEWIDIPYEKLKAEIEQENGGQQGKQKPPGL